MSVVIEELRTQIEAVQRNLVIADRSGLAREAYLRRARLQDLIDIAARHGIDVTAWVDQSLLAPLAPAEG
jgi:SepF-like predicted cell division protein (DUF552 family)